MSEESNLTKPLVINAQDQLMRKLTAIHMYMYNIVYVYVVHFFVSFCTDILTHLKCALDIKVALKHCQKHNGPNG